MAEHRTLTDIKPRQTKALYDTVRPPRGVTDERIIGQEKSTSSNHLFISGPKEAAFTVACCLHLTSQAHHDPNPTKSRSRSRKKKPTRKFFSDPSTLLRLKTRSLPKISVCPKTCLEVSRPVSNLSRACFTN